MKIKTRETVTTSIRRLIQSERVSNHLFRACMVFWADDIINE